MNLKPNQKVAWRSPGGFFIGTLIEGTINDLRALCVVRVGGKLHFVPRNTLFAIV